MAHTKTLAWSPIRNLMKSVGAQVVARDAVDALISVLVESGKEITTKAMRIMRLSKRVKLTKGDIDLSIKL
jgi:histone H3/H4